MNLWSARTAYREEVQPIAEEDSDWGGEESHFFVAGVQGVSSVNAVHYVNLQRIQVWQDLTTFGAGVFGDVALLPLCSWGSKTPKIMWQCNQSRIQLNILLLTLLNYFIHAKKAARLFSFKSKELVDWSWAVQNCYININIIQLEKKATWVKYKCEQKLLFNTQVALPFSHLLQKVNLTLLVLNIR